MNTATAIAFVLSSASLCSTRAAQQNIPKADKAAKYTFVENTDRYVEIIRGEWSLIGKFDSRGNFTHEYKLKTNQGASSLPAHTPLFNIPEQSPEKVFEFRSGMLVPGVLNEGGDFVPELNGKIIMFKDYIYSPFGPRIWNLPGWFEKSVK